LNPGFHLHRPIRRGDEEHHLLSLIPEENSLATPRSEDEINLEDLIRAIPLLGMEVYCEDD
jgi:hypothetical protein